jgi:hypothetical protein
VDEFDGSTRSKVSPGLPRMSWVGSVGSGNGLGVSTLGGRVGVGVGVEVDVAQPASRVTARRTTHILFIAASGKSIQEDY